MTISRGCEHEDTNVETASNRLNWEADPEGATDALVERHCPFQLHAQITKSYSGALHHKGSGIINIVPIAH